jgi:alpha-tubulin suppressor-like RCC1 family protein
MTNLGEPHRSGIWLGVAAALLAVAGTLAACRGGSPNGSPPACNDCGGSTGGVADAGGASSGGHGAASGMDESGLAGQRSEGGAYGVGGEPPGTGGGGGSDPDADGPTVAEPGAPLALGRFHSCALSADGTVKCWGDADAGVLGNGLRTGSEACLTSCETKPVDVVGLRDVVAIGAGMTSGYALLRTGIVKRWGVNMPVPTKVEGLDSVKAISIGDGWNGHNCAVLVDGTVKCWGYNGDGQLGNGDRMSSEVAVAVLGLDHALAVAVSATNTCALRSDHTVVCWGDNSAGQIGNGETGEDVLTPTPVAGITDAVQVSTWSDTSCALLASGSVECWGANAKIGRQYSFELSSLPTPVQQGCGTKAITGGAAHACSLLSDGHVRCWGGNNDGEIGSRPSDNCDLNDVYSDYCVLIADIPGLENVRFVASGNNHVCALLFDGTVKCWGSNLQGELGNGTWTKNPTWEPQTVQGLNLGQHCADDGSTCTAGDTCCSGTCTAGVCRAASCQAIGGSCVGPGDCCSGTCHPLAGDTCGASCSL